MVSILIKNEYNTTQAQLFSFILFENVIKSENDS